MPKIQFEIPKDLNKKINHYMIEKNIVNKGLAIIRLLGDKFKNDRKKD